MPTSTPPDTPATPAREMPPLRRFCELVLRLNGQPLRFDDRPYINDILAATGGNLMIRAGRQVEKSSLLSFRIAFELTQPGTSVLLVCPRETQAKLFMNSRFLPLLEESPILMHVLQGRKGRGGYKDIRFGNGSQLHVRSAYRSADGVRGVSADLLICDEYQDVAAGFLPVLKETLAHSTRPKTILTGTPKDITNHIEEAFASSTARAWSVSCESCRTDVRPDETSIGPDGPRCGHCGHPVDWHLGRWVATNPTSTRGEGFWLPQIITPWMTHGRYQEKAIEYDRDRLLNEVFGMPTTRGTLAITREELEACCTPRAMARSFGDLPADARATVMLGIDWGDGHNGQAAVVIASGCPFRGHLKVWHWAMLGGEGRSVVEEVRDLCSRFGVTAVFADARGGGAHENRALREKLGRDSGVRITGLVYGESDGPVNDDGGIGKQVIDRTKWFAGLFTRIRSKLIEFPRLEDCQQAFDHVGCEQVVYNEHSRTSIYQPAEGRSDDLLHALVYALVGVPPLLQAYQGYLEAE